MRSFSKKCMALCLALLLTLSCFAALPVAAAAPSGRFVFDSLRSERNKIYPSEERITLSVSEGDHSFSLRGLSLVAGESDAIYLSLINRCGATEVELSYTYEENAIKKTATARKALSPDTAEAQILLLDAPHITKNVSAITLSFSSDEQMDGTVVLEALFNFSCYVDDTAYEAAFTKCHYDEKSNTVEIEGDLSFEATAFYGDKHTLALFSLSSGEELHLSSKTPIARTGISLNFAFSVAVNSSDELFNRYVVAAVNEKGERIPLCAPMYPTLSVAARTDEIGFKGFHADSFSAVLDAAPGVEIVDVYLDQLQDNANGGILYAGEHSYYHFDQDYVEELDRRVRNLTGIGAHVYLRFLISPDANGFSFTDYSDPGLEIVNKLPAIRGQNAQRDIYAFTDFITARYADATIGRVSGIILGRCADLAATHAYNAEDDLAAYTKLYATALNLISGAAARNIPDINMIVPLSDRIWPGVMSEAQLSGEYYSELFLTSLFSTLTSQVMKPQPFALMLESAALPDRVSGVTGKTYGIDRLQDYFDMVDRVKAGHALTLSQHIFYVWTPNSTESEDALKAAYLLQYLALWRNDAVSAFVVDAAGDAKSTRALSYLARYIDTDEFEIVAQAALRALGVDSVSELYEDMQAKELQQRRIHRTALTTDAYSGSLTPTGSYTIWNFNAATGPLGWYTGNACTDLSVLTATDRSRSLTAQMDGKGDYGDIAYHFPEATDLTFAPMMRMTVGVQGVSNTRYEVQLRTIGVSDTVLASAIVNEGDTTELFLDLTSNKAALDAVRGLRLVARSLDGETQEFDLHLYTFVMESDTLTGTELAQRINAILRGTDDTNGSDEEKRDFTRPLVVSAIVLMVSVAITAFFVVRRKTKNRAR